jgi:hypothetical protein
MRRITVLITALLLALGVLAAPAAAHHQHYIQTPQGKQITLPCEPEGTAAADEHPLHWYLHVGPAQGIRAVHVHHYGMGTCSQPLPQGPNG